MSTLNAWHIGETPRLADAVPFASESGLQQFVEEHAEDLLGVHVVASSRKGGRGMFRIDTLAEDQYGRPWIIECKHDLVDSGALRQLRMYRESLRAEWSLAAPRFQGGDIIQGCPDPVLVAIGYRFDEGLVGDELVLLAYRYHDIAVTGSDLETQEKGRVSIHLADTAEPCGAHPKVSKRAATVERLKRFAPALADSFWRIDAGLRAMPGVNVKYGGKNFVRYNTRAGVFAEAVIGDGIIEWEVSTPHALRSESDEPKILALLQQARNQAR